MVNALSLGQTLTVELALDIDIEGQSDDWPNYFGMVDDYGVFTQVGNKRYIQWKNINVCGGSRPQFHNWRGTYLTALATEDDTYLFEGTTHEHAAARTKFDAFGAHNWTIGAAPWSGGRHVKGFYYAARIYNRPLTEAELAQNRKVDEVRFRGAVVTNVVVASALAGAQGVETNGVYEVEGSWTFTALPTVLESGKTVRPTGYSIETLENGVWSAPVAYTGTNYTYTASADVAPVRLTWRYHQGTVLLFR